MIRGSKHLKITSGLRTRLRAALKEDIGRGDVSSRVSFPAHTKGQAIIVAKQSGIVAGLPVASEIFALVDPKLEMIQKSKDGRCVRKGTVIATLRGNLRSILAGERLALNFIQRLSGIATLTNEFVHIVKGTHAKILDTRKTTPLWRDLEKYAVRIGGGFNHRFSLCETIIIKDTHWVALDHRKEFKFRRSVPLIIEVHSMDRLLKTLSAKPDIIMLDNWPMQRLRRGIACIKDWARKHNRPAPQIEASGGVNLSNVRNIARSGVDRISIGAITHSAAALDFSLKITRIT